MAHSNTMDGHETRSRNWREYFRFNLDHKVIGMQYLVAANVFLVIGVALAMLIRAQLLTPGMAVLRADQYNQVVTMHGTTMIFLWVIPAVVGLGNFILPLQIGAKDMAFPRLNALGLWLFLLSGLVIEAGFLVGAAAAGWTSYAPLSLQGPLGQTFWLIGLILTGASSIMGAVNFLTTVFTMRAPGVTFGRMPLFVWSMIGTSMMVLAGTPVLAAGLFLQLFDRTIGTTFFSPAGGGNPILWESLFWFYSHPAVYIMVLPGMGVISEVIPVFARKPIFGYRMIAGSSIVIAVLSLSVWTHHMFTSGLAPVVLFPMMLSSMVIAVPTGVKVFGWLATLWQGKLHLKTPLLFALGFLSQFLVAGITGVMQASIPLDIHFHGTYWLVGHFHYALFGAAVFAAISGIYFWYPKMTGHMFNEKLGRLHFVLAFLGFNGTYLPMFWLGLNGMPRRVATYIPEFTGVNRFVSICGFILGFSFLVMWINLLYSWLRGPRASSNPWRALTLEWTLPSPPPPGENFEHEPPQAPEDPYGFGTDVQYPGWPPPQKPAATPEPTA